MLLWRSKEVVVTVRKETYDTHYLISLSTGEVVGKHVWRAYSDEDDLWTTAQAIEGDRLITRTTIQGPYHPDEIYEERVLATGLEAVSDDATRSLVTSALAKADAAATNEQLAQDRAAAARVAAIPRGSADLRAGPLATRAQSALISRIERWSDERAGRLLRTLIKLADAKPTAEVLQAYACGCLSACYASDLPPLPSTSQQPPNAELAKELAERAQELERDGDGQEYVDAMNNARALWAAAKSIQWAADQLSPREKP